MHHARPFCICRCISWWIFINYIVCLNEREIPSPPCIDLSQEESFAKCLVSWRWPLSAKTLTWAGWFECVSVAGGYPVGFIWMKTCKTVTQEPDFLWGSGSEDASGTKSSDLKSYLPPLELSLSLLKPTLSLGSAGARWAVNQVTKPSADNVVLQNAYQNAGSWRGAPKGREQDSISFSERCS